MIFNEMMKTMKENKMVEGLETEMDSHRRIHKKTGNSRHKHRKKEVGKKMVTKYNVVLFVGVDEVEVDVDDDDNDRRCCCVVVSKL